MVLPSDIRSERNMIAQVPDRFKAANAFWIGLSKIGLTPAAVLSQARVPVTVFDGKKNDRLFSAHCATGHRRGLPARLHRAGRRPVSTAILILATLRRVAPAQTLPRGESGPEAGDGSVAQTCPSVLPPPEPQQFGRGFVFSKTEYWDQLPSLSSEFKCEACHGALFAPGLSLWIFSRDTLFCLYNEVSYPDRTRSLRPGCRHRQRGM